MISKQAVEDQLKRIGCNFRFWGRSEINELGRILMEDEVITNCVNGEYSNGFAMLVSTNRRLLLVDKKPLLYLTVEDVRYEMITEFNLNHRMLNAVINIYTANKTLTFSSWNQHRLRRLLEYVQSRVLEMHQHSHLANQFTAAAAAQFAQMYAANQAQTGNSEQTLAAAQPAASLPAFDQTSEVSKQPEVVAAPAVAQPIVPPAPQPAPTDPATITSRIAATGRAALGTYTRSKLPYIRRPSMEMPAASQPPHLPQAEGQY